MERDAIYEDVIRPLLFTLDPETAHHLAHALLRAAGPGMLPLMPYRYQGRDLSTNICGRVVANPVGLAAGFDKNAHLVSVLSLLGFGFAEVGSITARATNGNPRPRLFRLPADNAVINRLGLNGEGAQVVAERLAGSRLSLPTAVNIAKTHDPSIAGDAAIADILTSFNFVRNLDLLYVALNASCPNTREGCMKEKNELAAVLSEMQKANTRRLPLLVKVSPDSSDQLLDDIMEIGSRCRVAGYICGNTTVSRQALRTTTSVLEEIGHGGLSGEPLRPLALRLCKRIAERKDKEQCVIAVGGITSGSDAYRFIRAGACAVEVYTGLIYKGPSLPNQICTQLSKLLQTDGLTLEQAIGADLGQPVS